MSDALRACPWCGGAASDYSWIAGGWEVECNDCHASLPGHSRAEARAAWNRRAPVALPTREEMRDALLGNLRATYTERDGAEVDWDSVWDAADASLALIRERMGWDG